MNNSFSIYYRVKFSVILKLWVWSKCLSCLISLSWRSGLMFRCGVRRRLRCSSLWVWVLVLWSHTLPTTRGTTTAIETRSPCLESTSWRPFWPRWWCLPCWASEPKPSPQSVLNGQYAAQTHDLWMFDLRMHYNASSIFDWRCLAVCLCMLQ